jgi:hypothetical protein
MFGWHPHEIERDPAKQQIQNPHCFTQALMVFEAEND